MQAKLEARADEKGGWQDEELGFFYEQIVGESRELEQAIDEAEVAEMADQATPLDWGSVMEEAVDLANYAMMAYAYARRQVDWGTASGGQQ